jgi:hypothetical protein
MSKHLKRFLFLYLIISGLLVFGQVQDAGLWLSANVEEKITPAFSACFTEEVRMNENITEVGTLYSDIGLKYSFGARFKVGGSYRFSKKRLLDDTYENLSSWYMDFYYKEKIKPISLGVRLRYQSRYNEAFSTEYGVIGKSHMRLKMTLKYDLDKRFEPYIYAEPFFTLNNTVYSPFDQLRVCAGIEYTFNRMHMIDLHYLICKEYNVKHPQTDYVIGLSYYLTF